ncbi:MAG: PAS domain-containing protein [Planctomycetota bacterium]
MAHTVEFEHYLQGEFERRLRTDPAMMRFFSGDLLDGVWYWDLEHPEHEWMSPEFWRTLGFDPADKQHLASEWQDLIHPDDLATSIDNFQKHCADPSHPYDQVVRYRRADGSTAWIRCRGIAIRDEAGKPVRMLGTHSDITELRRYEEEHLRRERELRLILDSIPAYVYFKDGKNTILNLNRAAADAMKSTVEAVIGRPSEAFFPAEDAAAFLRDDLEVLGTGEPKLGIEEMHEGGEGEARLIRTDKFPLANERGEFDRLVAVATDITDLRQAEAALLVSQKQLAAIMDNAPALTYSKDRSGRFIQVNKRCADVIGVAEEDLVGRSHGEFFPPEISDTMTANDERVLETGEPLQCEEIGLVDGVPRSYLSTKFPLRDADGDIVAVGGVSTDVTDMLALRRELEEKNAELERFVYTASHDLKSPLVTILGFVGHLARDVEEGRTEELAFYASRIERAAQKMRSNVDDLLELSRLGRDRSEPCAVSIGDAVRDVLEAEASRIEALGIEVSVEIGADRVWCDPRHVTQVLENLIENALAYGSTAEAPTITVRADATAQGMVRLDVEDNGEGVDAKHADRVFELFERLSSSAEGTGVGLAIVRRVAQMYGGTAWVDPIPGGGAGFRLALPTGPAAGDERVS